MAKAGFTLYGARGKVGNLVARKGPKGGTVLAERVKPKNPQTNRQMAQRIILATVGQAAKYMTAIIDHSFQGVGVGAASKERFRKVNMDLLRQLAAIDFAEAPKPTDASVFMTTRNVTGLIPNTYIISQGNLASSKLDVTFTGTPGAEQQANVNFSDFTIPATGPADGIRTVRLGDILKAMFGIYAAGEQLTFVAIQKTGEGYKYCFNGDPDATGWMIPYTSMKAVRLFIDPSVDLDETYEITNASGQPLENIDEVIADNVIRAFGASARTERTFLNFLERYLVDINVTYTAGAATVAVAFDTPLNFTTYNQDADGLGYVYALGIIRSQLMTDATWQYSNTRMVMARPQGDEDFNFGLDWNSAIQAWFSGQDVASNELYLKAGTNQNEIGESFT